MLRKAEEKDFLDILDIYNDAILNTTALYVYTPYSMEEIQLWYTQKYKNGYPIFVWEEKNKVVAFATFGPFRTYPAYQYTIEHSVYVHPDYRKKGLATYLIKEIITFAREKGYVTLIGVIDSNNKGSIHIHEKMGFTFSGKITKAGYKFETWLDLVFYQLELK